MGIRGGHDSSSIPKGDLLKQQDIEWHFHLAEASMGEESQGGLGLNGAKGPYEF